MKKIENSLEMLKNILKNNESLSTEEFLHFLRFPSISTDPSYQKDILACVNWLKQYVENMGAKTELWETSGHPTLFASWDQAGPQKPTLLIYNHYDVQPVDPLNEWVSPPFEPRIENDEVYARGACDDKGQCFYVLQAIKALLERDKCLPINIKLCIEGEEEIGSAGLSKLLNSKVKELSADYLAIVDLGLRDPNIPAITLGTRGIVTFTVKVEGSSIDLHSGGQGGIVYNPLHALVEVLATIRDSQGKVNIPGFYDKVIPLTDIERNQISFKFDEASYFEKFGATPTGGEQNFSPLERAWIRPTLEINGISGGYGGEGFKTVIPAKAIAKISCRLVPNQDPSEIAEKVAITLKERAPKGIKFEVQTHLGMGAAVRTSPNSKGIKAFAKAYSEVFGKPCEFIFEGGSIPIVPELAKASHAQVILMGLGLADDKIHAPNEHFGLKRIEKGALVIARAIELL